MSDLKGCRAVVFDAYGTLFNVGAPARILLGERGDALAALRALRAAERRTAILSNGSPEMLVAAVGHAGLESTLEMVLSVEEAGVFKPHPKVYALASQHLELPPEQICFVSANGWDAAGAAAFGFAVVWLDRRGEREDRLPGGPAARVASLSELPALLCATS